ncbi:MAG: hypothetical protein RL217_1562 [Pseudomonadota bacterium]
MVTETSSANPQLDALPEARKLIIVAIKKYGMACASTLAQELGLTREACRQQLQILQQQGLIASHSESQGGAGRPKQLFALSNQGEHLFPKHYDQLTVQIIDTVQEQLGSEPLKAVLSAISQKQVAQWQEQMQGLTLREKLRALKNFYFSNDPFTEVVEDDAGLWLVEKNCPFLNLANERPPLCSVTVSTLMRLLGVRVVREKRFQAGDGHCAFHVFPDQPIAADFIFEFER